MATKSRIRMGMIGGGPGAFIGNVHRMAANLDGEIELVCGAFSRDPEKSKEAGEELALDPDRVYPDFKSMILAEKDLPADQRMEFVSIVTPNHVHFEPADLALKNGFHVVIDKPVTFSLEEAKKLAETLKASGLQLCLTHTYTGYPMIKEAKSIVDSGKLGVVRKVYVEYPQGWLSTKLEEGHQKQADWRTDPKRSGMGGAVGDIGTHAENLAEYVTGLKITEVNAQLNTVVEGRLLDDDSSILLRFDNGATGNLIATQVAAGEENDLKLRVYGEFGGIEWCHGDPNTLWVKWLDKPAEKRRAGVDNSYLSEEALIHSRTPSGHPEGYIEAFANLYRNFAFTMRSLRNGETPDPRYLDFPGIEDGIRGMAFIETVVTANNQPDKWVKLIH